MDVSAGRGARRAAKCMFLFLNLSAVIDGERCVYCHIGGIPRSCESAVSMVVASKSRAYDGRAKGLIPSKTFTAIYSSKVNDTDDPFYRSLYRSSHIVVFGSFFLRNTRYTSKLTQPVTRVVVMTCPTRR